MTLLCNLLGIAICPSSHDLQIEDKTIGSPFDTLKWGRRLPKPEFAQPVRPIGFEGLRMGLRQRRAGLPPLLI